jgi:flagellar hook-associated protein 2
MGLSSAGIGSGLDVNSIVTSLMSIEQKPLTAVATQKTDYQSKISAYGTLKSTLSTFETSVNALSSASKFNAQTVTSGNTNVFTATSNGSASLGDYAVTVSQLAKSQKLSFTGTANVADVVGTGTITISFPANTDKSDVTISIDSSNNSLSGIRDAINSSNSSVSSTIVNDGTVNHLVITSKDSGEINSLEISVVETGASGLSKLEYGPTASASSAMTQLQAAQNAILNIDGIDVIKASNTITDAISGVTLNLLSTSELLPLPIGGAVSTNLGVASNHEAIKTSVTSFVDAYNKLDTTLRSLTKYDPTGKASGALLGDATARSVINQLKSVMNKTITSGGTLTSLSQIGVAFQRDGSLALDSTKLDTAITNNFSDIATLFATSAKSTNPQISYVGGTSKTQAGSYAVSITASAGSVLGTINGVAATVVGLNLIGATGDASEGLNIKAPGLADGATATGTINYIIGYASQFDSIITNILSDTGILASRTEGINSSISSLDKKAESIKVRLTAIEARYRAQFTKLDTLMASMTTTSTFLTQQLASINSNK